jgi:catechol 2,3-dioxygenase-like lactoylglutathione lyase family enzyme
LNDPPYVHVGVLVNDLEASIEAYSRLGLSFMEPRTVRVERLVENGSETSLDLRIVFSHQGPPQWELLQAVGDGIYGPRHAEKLHHVAILADHPIARRAELVEQGFRETAAQYRSDDSLIVSYLDPADLNGIRIELLDVAVQDAIMEWVEGRDAAP